MDFSGISESSFFLLTSLRECFLNSHVYRYLFSKNSVLQRSARTISENLNSADLGIISSCIPS